MKLSSLTSKIAKSDSKDKWMIFALIVLIAVLIAAIALNMNRFNGGSIAAVVNGEAITTNELDMEYEFVFFMMAYPDEYRQMLTKEDFLGQMIDEELLMQDAAKKGIVVKEDEADDVVNRIMAAGNLSAEGIEKILQDNGFSMDYFREYYKKQLLMSKLLNSTIAAEVNDSEIFEYYNKNNAQFKAGQGEIRARHILVETEEDANEIRGMIMSGADFADIAEESSIDMASAVNGGELGFFGKGQMVADFEKAAFALKVNEISEPVKTQFGWHLIERESDVIKISDAYDTIKKVLLAEKQRKAIELYLDELMENADVAIVMKGANVTDECYRGYGISKETVIFYYADWCPYCKKMKDVVDELEIEGYDFYWANAESDDAKKMIDECFSDIVEGAVPEFICAGSKEFKLGEMSKAELKGFAERCRGG